MASNEDQGQSSQQSAENYWLQCIKTWYPKLHTQTYFLPPLHFNRVPYSVENIAGEQVLVAQIPQDGPSQTPSTAKSRSRKQKRQTTSSSDPNLSDPVGNSSRDNFHLKPVYDSDVRDDKALERVLYCLRALAYSSQPKEVMMVISQLQFGNYLGQPSYAATAALLPRPSTLPEHFLQQHYHEGDFDVLIIHRQHGLFTLEIKSVGANFSQLKMTEQQQDDVVMKKVKEALNQLSKSEVVLKHLTSDLTVNNITKILAMPNISSPQLLRAISRNPSDDQGLCHCLGVRNVHDALKMCLLSDQLSDKRTASNVNHVVLKNFCVWWQQLGKMSGAQTPITETVYEQLVARKPFTEFCYQLIVQVPGVYLWGASVYHEVRPLCLEEVKLTTPLRSPPVVVREVMEASEIKEKQVHDYTVSDVPVPTDGPAVIRFTHRDGQSGHTEEYPRDCVECGLQVARVLTGLNVGRTGNSNGPPPLQYRDVLMLCDDYPTDDQVDNNGQVIISASGLVQGLRACHVPVRVVEEDDEAAIRDTALGVGDLVTVTNWRDVRGLERKVVVVQNKDYWEERLYAMSRCTSQLVVID